jgi:hypothetical protein
VARFPAPLEILVRFPAPHVSPASCSQHGAGVELLSFAGPAVALRTAGGAVVRVSVSPYPLLLAQAAVAGRWEAATRLCRFVGEEGLWASLASRALAARETATAEAAYAALGQVSRPAPCTRLPTESPLVPTAEGSVHRQPTKEVDS